MELELRTAYPVRVFVPQKILLAGSTFTKAAAARRAKVKYMYNEQMNTYWARHRYFDI